MNTYQRFINIISWGLIALLSAALTYYGWQFIRPEVPDAATTTTHTEATIDSASTTTTHTTIVAKPDGSSVTTTNTTAQVNTHAATQTTATTSTPVAVRKTRYSVGVRAIYDVKRLDVRPKAYDIDTGIRLWQTNLWVETGSRIEAGRINEVSLGMRVEL
jgi:hypothetical protein